MVPYQQPVRPVPARLAPEPPPKIRVRVSGLTQLGHEDAVGMGSVHDADDAGSLGSVELLDQELEVRASVPHA